MLGWRDGGGGSCFFCWKRSLDRPEAWAGDVRLLTMDARVTWTSSASPHSRDIQRDRGLLGVSATGPCLPRLSTLSLKSRPSGRPGGGAAWGVGLPPESPGVGEDTAPHPDPPSAPAPRSS